MQAKTFVQSFTRGAAAVTPLAASLIAIAHMTGCSVIPVGRVTPVFNREAMGSPTRLRRSVYPARGSLRRGVSCNWNVGMPTMPASEISCHMKVAHLNPKTYHEIGIPLRSQPIGVNKVVFSQVGMQFSEGVKGVDEMDS